jgi:hypothetical protein
MIGSAPRVRVKIALTSGSIVGSLTGKATGKLIGGFAAKQKCNSESTFGALR